MGEGKLLTVADEKPIRNGGCSAGRDGHSGIGFAGNGNSGSDGVENSGVGLTSNGFPMASTKSSLRLCVSTLKSVFDFSDAAWNASNASRTACAVSRRTSASR